MLWGLMDNSQSTLSHSWNYTRRIWLRGKEGLCFLRTKTTLWLQSLHTFHEDLSGTICLLAGLSQARHPFKYLYIIRFLYLSRWISIDWTFTIVFIGSRFTNLWPTTPAKVSLGGQWKRQGHMWFLPLQRTLNWSWDWPQNTQLESGQVESLL